MRDQLDKWLPRDELQEELRDLLSLAVVGDHIRWVVIGEGAAELAEWLAGATSRWRASADQVATHMVSMGVAPDGRLRSLAKDIPIHWIPDGWIRHDEALRLLVGRLGILAGWARYRQSQAIEPDTVRLFDAVATGLERHADAGKRLMRPHRAGSLSGGAGP
jgi:starvation-inducible DNA-binding protein